MNAIRWSVCVLGLVSQLSLAEVYVANGPDPGGLGTPSVLVYASDARGDTAPIREISGEHTRLYYPFGVAVDEVHNELFVADFGLDAIYVFPLDGNGDIYPLRTIVGVGFPRHLIVNTDADELIVSNYNGLGEIRTYRLGAEGNEPPLRVLTGPTSLINNPISIMLDRSDDTLITNSYLFQEDAYSGIFHYDRGANGDVAPVQQLSGPSTQLYFSTFLAFSQEHNELFSEINYDEDGIAVFDAEATGNSAPLRVINGQETGLYYMTAMDFDTVNDRILTGNFTGFTDAAATITVHDRNANGDAAPVATIGGPDTHLQAPHGFAIDSRGGFSKTGPVVQYVQDDFDNLYGDSTGMPTEDFDDGAASSGHVVACTEPLSSTSNDDCFSPGQLLDGFSLRSSSGNGLAAVGSGLFDNASTAVGPASDGDSLMIDLDRPTSAISMDVYLYQGGDVGRVDVNLLDASGQSIGYAPLYFGDGNPKFVGALATMDAVRHIELTPSQGGVFIDHLRFFQPEIIDSIFANGFEP
jgi:6-phosphogluconolactonase (cycloisomerase 2 family)